MHDENGETPEDNRGSPRKKKYEKPRVIVYGQVRSLTASGSGSQSETPGNMPVTKKP
jgi:hypothetical protein